MLKLREFIVEAMREAVRGSSENQAFISKHLSNVLPNKKDPDPE